MPRVPSIDDGRMPATFSTGFFDETERPGQPFPVDTHMIIRDRYDLAVELAEGQRVLEVGCGAGLGLQYLSDVAKSLHAVEFSAENVDLLRLRHGKNFAVVRSDAHLLPFGDGRFDLVVALAMIYYLDAARFMDEVRRVLAPGGRILFCTSNKDVPGFCAAPYTTRYLGVPELSSLLEGAGFEGRILGSFPASGGLARRRVRAWAKNAAKAFMTRIPGGDALWASLRRQSLADVRPLPPSVDEMPRPTTARQSLETDRPDRTHRVIYVIATRKP